MSRLAAVVWLASVVLDTAGRLAFKSAAVTETAGSEWRRWQSMLRSPMLLLGIVCFCLEFVDWLALLSLVPLSQAVLLGAINIATVSVAGRLVFGERLDASRIGGILLITVGVILAGVS
jgi:drug/metabolite transporter (DMT)-like permease